MRTLAVVALVALAAVLLQVGLERALRVRYPVHTSGAVVISGASTGIGAAAAEMLARNGFTVFAGVRSQADIDRTAGKPWMWMWVLHVLCMLCVMCVCVCYACLWVCCVWVC